MRGSPEDLHVNSRSMLQILQGFASFVEVPEEDVRAGRAAPSAVGSGDADLGRIRSGAAKPDRAYAAVRYRDRWYWIEDGDYRTKRALTAVMFFFTLADTGGADRLPLVTIPAQ
jgi:hypothetical protein